MKSCNSREDRIPRNDLNIALKTLLLATGAGLLGGCATAGSTISQLDTQIGKSRMELAIEQSHTQQLTSERRSLESELRRLQSRRRELVAQPQGEARNSAIQQIDSQITTMKTNLRKLESQL